MKWTKYRPDGPKPRETYEQRRLRLLAGWIPNSEPTTLADHLHRNDAVALSCDCGRVGYEMWLDLYGEAERRGRETPLRTVTDPMRCRYCDAPLKVKIVPECPLQGAEQVP